MKMQTIERAGLVEPRSTTPQAALKLFDRIPARHGVIAVTDRDHCALLREGEVAVYDEDNREPVEGALFAIEWRKPAAGMSWEIFWRNQSMAIKVDRAICRVERWPGKLADHWAIHPLRTVTRLGRAPVVMMSDGPYEDIYLRDILLGRIVGIYAPATFGEGR